MKICCHGQSRQNFHQIKKYTWSFIFQKITKKKKHTHTQTQNGEHDDKFEIFWKAYYHGYKATEEKEGGFSKNDFIDMVTRNRLSRSAAYLLFQMIDFQKAGFVDLTDMKKVWQLKRERLKLTTLLLAYQEIVQFSQTLHYSEPHPAPHIRVYISKTGDLSAS